LAGPKVLDANEGKNERWSVGQADPQTISTLPLFERLIIARKFSEFGLAKRHRSRTDMIAAILQAAAGGSKFTRIMFTAYMSYQQCTEYIELVRKRDLLSFDRGSKTYSTTPKGRQFLGIYEKIRL
jgi:predicted transcriptional regulator